MCPFSRRKRSGLLIILVLITGFLPEVLGASIADQVSRVLNDLMKKPYDKRVRPLYGDGPLFVRFGVYVESVSGINEPASELTVNFVLKSQWLEPRLTFNRGLVPNNTLQIIPEQVKLLWVPNTIVVNQRRTAFTFDGHESTRLISEGQVSTSVRMTATTECVIQYSYFPFDTQMCDIQFSSYAKDCVYEWDEENSGVKKGIQTSEFQLLSYNAKRFSREDGHKSPVFTMIFVRKWHSYYLAFYSPMLVFTFVSLLTLWLFNHRIGVVINFLNLPLMNIFVAAGNSIIGRPITDVTTAMDQFASLCYYVVFLCALVNTAEFYFEREENARKEEERKALEDEEDEESPNFQMEDTKKKETKLSKLKPFLDMSKNSLKTICQHSHWILLVGFLLCNVFYWGLNFSGQNSRIKFNKQSDD